MNSYLLEDFFKYFRKLPERIQIRARQAYRRWKANPYDTNLQFKKVHPTKPIYSVRVSIGWRALGYKKNNSILWFWIGSHESYNKLVSQL